MKTLIKIFYQVAEANEEQSRDSRHANHGKEKIIFLLSHAAPVPLNDHDFLDFREKMREDYVKENKRIASET